MAKLYIALLVLCAVALTVASPVAKRSWTVEHKQSPDKESNDNVREQEELSQDFRLLLTPVAKDKERPGEKGTGEGAPRGGPPVEKAKEKVPVKDQAITTQQNSKEVSDSLEELISGLKQKLDAEKSEDASTAKDEKEDTASNGLANDKLVKAILELVGTESHKSDDSVSDHLDQLLTDFLSAKDHADSPDDDTAEHPPPPPPSPSPREDSTHDDNKAQATVQDNDVKKKLSHTLQEQLAQLDTKKHKSYKSPAEHIYKHRDNMVEGDIVLSAQEMEVFKAKGWGGLVRANSLWENNWSRVIPYIADGDLDIKVIGDLQHSVRLLQQKTCLSFARSDSINETRIHFATGDGCYTSLGRPAEGRERTIVLGPGCTQGSALHEILHVLGIHHEHTRYDRDTYITVHEENFDSNPLTPEQFRKRTDIDTKHLPYDYDSIMHYPAWAFSNGNGPTITPNDPSVDPNRLGQMQTLSHYDTLRVNIEYCPEKTIRLSEGHGSYEGRIEVHYNGEWGSVCENLFEYKEATVTCRYLGFLGAERVLRVGDFAEGVGPIWLDRVNCDGSEASPFHCQHAAFGIHNCDHSEDIGVRCINNVRLVDGPNSTSGRVEVNYNGIWGTVCDDYFDINDANVICRQLGHRAASRIHGNAHFGEGAGLIVLDDLDCSGSEDQVIFCRHSAFGYNNCDHSEDVGVVCTNSM